MKTYPYNRASAEGRRLFRLLDARFNKGSLDVTSQSKSFENYEVPAVTQCRTNKVGFLFSSNLSGIKRPQIRVEADVEAAWGEFAEGINTLDFTHGGQELPLTYVQPLEDDTLKMLIDAGLYRDENFEALMNKLMVDEVFDAEADMNVTYLDVEPDDGSKKNIQVLMVDPVSVVHEEYDPSEQTTIANLVRRSARLAIELRKEGVRTDELVRTAHEPDLDREVILTEDFQDVVAQRAEETQSTVTEFVEASELLDAEIDVTEKLKDSLTFDGTSEDDRIRDLKERDRYESSYVEADSDISNVVEPVSPRKPKESERVLDADVFGNGLDDYEIEAEDDGPSL